MINIYNSLDTYCFVWYTIYITFFSVMFCCQITDDRSNQPPVTHAVGLVELRVSLDVT